MQEWALKWSFMVLNCDWHVRVICYVVKFMIHLIISEYGLEYWCVISVRSGRSIFYWYILPSRHAYWFIFSTVYRYMVISYYQLNGNDSKTDIVIPVHLITVSIYCPTAKVIKLTKKKCFPGPMNFQISIFVIYFEPEMIAYTSATATEDRRFACVIESHNRYICSRVSQLVEININEQYWR